MLGVLYASVVSRFIFFRVLRHSKHRYSHSVVGWTVWALIIAGVWVFAFVIAGVIPFFNDLLSLMSSLFDSFFGFIFWGLAYLQLNRGRLWNSWWKCILTVINVTFIGVGVFFLSIPSRFLSNCRCRYLCICTIHNQ
jgi:Transmembrane amino acid transporter protein